MHFHTYPISCLGLYNVHTLSYCTCTKEQDLDSRLRWIEARSGCGNFFEPRQRSTVASSRSGKIIYSWPCLRHASRLHTMQASGLAESTLDNFTEVEPGRILGR